MTDLAFIIELGNSERPALGHIPAPSIKRRMTDTGCYVVIRDDHAHRRGFILHGPPRAGVPLHIYQTCVETDYRLRAWAAQAVNTVAQRGLLAGATEVNLRCAADLPALAFWTAIGFTFRQWHVGGNQRQRLIAEMYLPLSSTPSIVRPRRLTGF